MPLMSPGGQLLPVLSLLLLFTLKLSSGGLSENVVIEIGNIKQPENCSLFLTNLDVTFIITMIISLDSGKDISTYHHNLSEKPKI